MRVWWLVIVAVVACRSDFEKRASKAIRAIKAAIEVADYANAQRLCDENPVTGQDRRDDVIVARELYELCWAELPRVRQARDGSAASAR